MKTSLMLLMSLILSATVHAKSYQLANTAYPVELIAHNFAEHSEKIVSAIRPFIGSDGLLSSNPKFFIVAVVPEQQARIKRLLATVSVQTGQSFDHIAFRQLAHERLSPPVTQVSIERPYLGELVSYSYPLAPGINSIDLLPMLRPYISKSGYVTVREGSVDILEYQGYQGALRGYIAELGQLLRK